MNLPFFLWPVIGGVVIFVLFLTRPLLPPNFEAALFEFSQQRLEAFPQKDSIPRVIALGTSRARCATYIDKEMENFFSSYHPAAMHFLRITRSGGFFAEFEPLLPKLLDTFPDVILIEPSILLYQWENSQELYPRKVLKEKIRCFLCGDPFAQKLYWEEQISEIKNENKTEALFKDYLKIRKKTQEWVPISFSLVHQFLEEARNRGIRVILLDIPACKIVEDQLKEEEALKRERMAYLQKTYDLKIWRFEQNESLDYYSDFSHFNKKGQREFSLWLCDHLYELTL